MDESTPSSKLVRLTLDRWFFVCVAVLVGAGALLWEKRISDQVWGDVTIYVVGLYLGLAGLGDRALTAARDAVQRIWGQPQ